MSSATVITHAKTSDGSFVVVNGRGTMKESAPMHELLLQELAQGAKKVTVDLSRCDYLDSTFLGALVDLFKVARRMGNQFCLCRPSESCRSLLDKTRLSSFLEIITDRPSLESELTAIGPSQAPATDRQVGEHIMKCHRHLAEIEGPNQKAFAAVANQLEKELAKR